MSLSELANRNLVDTVTSDSPAEEPDNEHGTEQEELGEENVESEPQNVQDQK